MTRWLILLGDTDSQWLRVDGDTVTARGTGLALPETGPVVVAVPGSAVALHWVELPPLAPAQALAAARLLAADVSAAPLADTHVALGAADDDGLRPLALVDAALMTGWLARLTAAGIAPAAIVPLPLLLPYDGETAACLTEAGTVTVRAPRLAFAAEAGLAALLLADRPRRELTPADFAAGLAERLDALPIDLRQGDFAPRRQWQVAPSRLRRIALLLAAAAIVWLAGDVASLLRLSLAADRTETELTDAARAALPRGAAIDNPRAQVAARYSGLGAGAEFSALAAPVLTALRDRSGLALETLQYSPDTGLALVVVAPTQADQQALARSLASVAASIGPPRDLEGNSVIDVTVQPR